MSTEGTAGHIGELMRQLRRQWNFTQTELGAPRYSKSYVSAVEKNAVRPSSEALQFFAEQLGQPSSYFTEQLNSATVLKQDQDIEIQGVRTKSDQSFQDEATFWLELQQQNVGHLIVPTR